VPGGAPIANGAVVALRVVDRGGRPSMRPGWVSRDLVGPLTPITVNGVVFAAASGRSASSGAATSAPDQVSGAKPAVLYAFDGRNGKELWNSGQTMTSFMSTRSLWSSNSQVHVGTHDGTIYAFGFTLERR
jgi:outer membrane protein assembly factor BamB